MLTITIDNFNYRGYHFESYKCKMPNVTEIDDIAEERIIEKVKESLDTFIAEELA